MSTISTYKWSRDSAGTPLDIQAHAPDPTKAMKAPIELRNQRNLCLYDGVNCCGYSLDLSGNFRGHHENEI